MLDLCEENAVTKAQRLLEESRETIAETRAEIAEHIDDLWTISEVLSEDSPQYDRLPPNALDLLTLPLRLVLTQDVENNLKKTLRTAGATN